MIPESGRSPGEGNGNPLQYSHLENPKDRGAWQATIHVAARVGHDLVTKEREHTQELLAVITNKMTHRRNYYCIFVYLS